MVHEIRKAFAAYEKIYTTLEQAFTNKDEAHDNRYVSEYFFYPTISYLTSET